MRAGAAWTCLADAYVIMTVRTCKLVLRQVKHAERGQVAGPAGGQPTGQVAVVQPQDLRHGQRTITSCIRKPLS